MRGRLEIRKWGRGGSLRLRVGYSYRTPLEMFTNNCLKHPLQGKSYALSLHGGGFASKAQGRS